MPVFVVQGGEQSRERRDRIRDRAAENARVQIHFGAGHFHFECGDAAQTVAQCRHALRDHAGIGDDRDIALQRVAIIRQKFRQITAADFLFAFDNEVEIHGQVAVLLHRFLNAEDVRQNLTLVIRRAAGKHVAVFQDRLERRRFPELERIGRLNIVMPVDHHGAPARLLFVSRPDDGMPGGRDELRFEPDGLQLLHQPLRATVYLFLVLIVGRNAGEPEERIIIVEITVAHA